MKAGPNTRGYLLKLGLLAALAMLGYLIFSKAVYGIGYPLDDSWIHQTYARNLAELGEWAFLPGQPSSGATSPLWAALLSIGYAVGLNHYIWTFMLGWLLLWGNGIFAILLFQVIAPSKGQHSKWVGAIIVLEWHFVWAAVSGMETMLFSLLVMAVFVGLLKVIHRGGESVGGIYHWLLLGVLCGVSVWIRPEGLLIAALIGVGILFMATNWRRRIQFGIATFLGLGISVAPYLYFNSRINGLSWPSTFYAKQAEYMFLQETFLLGRIIEQGGVFLVGIGVIILPGFLILAARLAKEGQWANLLPLGWVAVHILVYAFRLPVIYQHGRYMMPAMPVFLVYGIAGFINWIDIPRERIGWVMGRVWGLSLSAVLIMFYILGARSYAMDVAVINSEMVAVAEWIRENTEETDLVAAHDIGALGYFSERRIIDLAGLVSPEVIEFINDEKALEGYLVRSAATHLVTFPGLYPQIISGMESVFDSDGQFSPRIGGENLVVFVWQKP